MAMINFHRRDDGWWSYTAYKLDWTPWITNTRKTDPTECIREIYVELEKEAAIQNTPNKPRRPRPTPTPHPRPTPRRPA